MALTAYSLLDFDADFSQRYNTGFTKASAAVIYKGAAVGAQGATGYCRTLVAGDTFIGFAEETVTPAATDGAVTVGLRTAGAAHLSVSGAAVTDLGRDVYASDESTFTFTATNNSLVGKVIRFSSSGKVVVAFNTATGVN